MTAIDTFKTPLRQLTGTCYFNSVLNGILADPKLSRIFFYKVYGYREELRLTDPTRYADFINTTGEALCPHPRFADKALREDPSDPRFKEMRYIVMKYFYALLCQGSETLELSKTVDIADRMAKVIHKPMTKTTEQDTEGGNTFKILLNILRTLYGSEFWDKVTFVEDMTLIPNEKAEILIHTRQTKYLESSNDASQSVPKKRGLFHIFRELDIDNKTITISIDKLLDTIVNDFSIYLKKINDKDFFSGYLNLNYFTLYKFKIYDILKTQNEDLAEQFMKKYETLEEDYRSNLPNLYKEILKPEIQKEYFVQFLKLHSDFIFNLVSFIAEYLNSSFENKEIQITIKNVLDPFVHSQGFTLFLEAAGYNVDDIVMYQRQPHIKNTVMRQKTLLNNIYHNSLDTLELTRNDIFNDSAKNYDFSFIIIICLIEESSHAVIGKYYDGNAYIIDSNQGTNKVIDWKEFGDIYGYINYSPCQFPCSVHVRSDLLPLSTADLKRCDIITKKPFIQRFFTKSGGSQKRTIVYGGKKYPIQTGSKGGRYILVEGKKKYI